MTARDHDPKPRAPDIGPPPRDHTVAIIAGLVALVGLLVVLAVGLEREKSPNTMAIIGVLATTIAAGVITQVSQLSGIKRDTAQIQHALNGNFEPRVTGIVGPLLDEKFGAFDATLDSRIRAGVLAVLQDRETDRDTNIREIVRDELASSSWSS